MSDTKSIKQKGNNARHERLTSARISILAVVKDIVFEKFGIKHLDEVRNKTDGKEYYVDFSSLMVHLWITLDSTIMLIRNGSPLEFKTIRLEEFKDFEVMK